MGWGEKNAIEHIGLVVGIIDKKTVLTIEGNTSDKNQANGGMVMVKERTIGKEIIGFARPKYLAYSGEYPVVEIPKTGILKGKKK